MNVDQIDQLRAHDDPRKLSAPMPSQIRATWSLLPLLPCLINRGIGVRVESGHDLMAIISTVGVQMGGLNSELFAS